MDKKSKESMKEIGKMTKEMDLVTRDTKTGINMKENF